MTMTMDDHMPPLMLRATKQQLEQLGFECTFLMTRGVDGEEYFLLVKGGNLRIGAMMGLFTPILYLYGISLIILPLLFQWLVPVVDVRSKWAMVVIGLACTVTGVALDMWGRRK